MKIRLIFILTTIFIQSTFGQSEKINQVTVDGTKDGKWVTYYPNGQVWKIEHYRAIRKKVTEEELFESNGKLTERFNKVDSTRPGQISVGQWIVFWENGDICTVSELTDNGEFIKGDQYEYGINGELSYIRRTENNLTEFIVGKTDSISFSTISFNETKPAHTLFEIKTRVKNITKKEIRLTVQSNDNLKVQSKMYLLEPSQTLDIVIPLQILPGRQHENISLTTDKWKFNLELISLGYDLSLLDFELKDKKQLKNQFLYYKTGDEFQMEILKSTTTKPTIIPISSQFTAIELEPGTYKLTSIGTRKRLTKEIEIK